VMLSRGETAYVRGDLKGNRDFRVFRESVPLAGPRHRRGAWLRSALPSAPPSSSAMAACRPRSTATARRSCGHLQDDHHPPGGRRRRSAGAGARARLQRLCAACGPAQAMKGRIISIYGEAILSGHRTRSSPINRRQQRRHRARPRDGAVARLARAWPNDQIGPKPLIEIARRAHRHVVCVPRLRIACRNALIIQSEDPVKAGRPFHPALSAPSAARMAADDADELAAWLLAAADTTGHRTQQRAHRLTRHLRLAAERVQRFCGATPRVHRARRWRTRSQASRPSWGVGAGAEAAGVACAMPGARLGQPGGPSLPQSLLHTPPTRRCCCTPSAAAS